FLTPPRPPPSPLFPYTTLFRSPEAGGGRSQAAAPAAPASDARRGQGRPSIRRFRAGAPGPPVGRAGDGCAVGAAAADGRRSVTRDRKSTRLNSSHQIISYAVFC